MESIGEWEYDPSNILGCGSFAMVLKGRSKMDPTQEVAVKKIMKKGITKSMNLLDKEIKILKEIKHENVVSLLDFQEKHECYLLVLEFCNGGDLADYLHDKGSLSEDTIRLFLKQLAEAMKCLHSRGIVHRDLKPQNILLNHTSPTTPSPHEITLKIADFGFARVLSEGNMAKTLCGSPMYMAPEVIMSKQYDHKADLWSIGTIVYQSLTGVAPFQANNPNMLKARYENEPNLIPKIPIGTSVELTSLLIALLKRNPLERINFEDFFNHDFLKQKTYPPSSPVSVPSLRSPSSVSSSCSSPRGMRCSTPISNTPPYRPPSEDYFIEQQQSLRRDLKMLSDSEDFVMVPSVINEEMCEGSSEKWPYKDSPSRSQVSPLIQSPKSSSPSSSPKYSSPIPVPSNLVNSKAREAFMEGKMSPLSRMSPKQDSSNEIGRLTPDISSITPPSVQFTIGTPPLGLGRRRSLSGGNPWRQSPLMFRNSSSGSLSGSPSRRSGFPTPPTNYLPPILASPAADYNSDWNNPEPYRTNPKLTFTGGRTVTLPDMNRQGSRESFLQRSGSLGQVMENQHSNWSEHSSVRSPRARFYSDSSNGPIMFPFGAASPPGSDGQLMFIAPDLNEETLLNKEHNIILAKLNFILTLVECILDLAKSKSSPIKSLSQSYVQKDTSINSVEQISVFSEGYRRAEQLVLYMRALNLLSASLQYSQQEVEAGKLQASSKVKYVLKTMNNHFHMCLKVCKSLNATNILKSNGVDPASSNITADKLIYTYAIELCQLAAMDELFGTPQECFRRYQHAHVLLHSLGFQVIVQEDKAVLNKYKTAVEQRLAELVSQGYYFPNAYN